MVCYLPNSLALQNNPWCNKKLHKSHSTEIETFRKASTKKTKREREEYDTNSQNQTFRDSRYTQRVRTVTLNGMLSEFENFNMF